MRGRHRSVLRCDHKLYRVNGRPSSRAWTVPLPHSCLSAVPMETAGTTAQHLAREQHGSILLLKSCSSGLLATFYSWLSGAAGVIPPERGRKRVSWNPPFQLAVSSPSPILLQSLGAWKYESTWWVWFCCYLSVKWVWAPVLHGYLPKNSVHLFVKALVAHILGQCEKSHWMSVLLLSINDLTADIAPWEKASRCHLVSKQDRKC